VNHDRSCNEIAQTLVLAAQQHAANSDGIKAGNWSTMRSRLRPTDSAGVIGLPESFDDAKTFLLFSRRLAIPDNFENGEIPK